MDMKDEFSVSLSTIRMVVLVGRWTYKRILGSLVGACALFALIGGTELVANGLLSLAVFLDRSKHLPRQGWRQLVVRLSRALHFVPGCGREPIRAEFIDCLIEFGVAAVALPAPVDVVVVCLVPPPRGGGRHFFFFSQQVVVVHRPVCKVLVAEVGAQESAALSHS